MTLDEAAQALRDADQAERDAEADWTAAKREADAAQARYHDARERASKAAVALVRVASPEAPTNG